MAMSGSVSSSALNQGGNNSERLVIDWSATYDIPNLRALVTISARIQKYVNRYPTRTYRVSGGTSDNYISVNGSHVFETHSYGTGYTKSNPINTYTNSDNISDEVLTVTNWYEREGLNTYVRVIGVPISSYSFYVSLNDEGVASFTLAAQLTTGMNGTMLLNSTTVTTAGTPAQIFSVVYKRVNNDWSNTGRIWHKENGTWIKRYLYRKENGQWVKK